MHTAFDFKKDDFLVTKNGAPIDRDDLLDWGVRDRLGVLVDRPVGTLGAGLLILLTITAFYDCKERARRRMPIYPDIFLFQVGGRWGTSTMFDFWPDHKEILVDADPREVLRVINNRGITHLVVPERVRRATKHRYKEPEAAVDRMKQCFVYSPSGAVQNGNISIETGKQSIFTSYAAVLDNEAYFDARTREQKSGAKRLLTSSTPEELALALAYVRGRLGEVSKDDPHWIAASGRFAAAYELGRLSETFREAQIEEALEMLG